MFPLSKNNKTKEKQKARPVDSWILVTRLQAQVNHTEILRKSRTLKVLTHTSDYVGCTVSSDTWGFSLCEQQSASIEKKELQKVICHVGILSGNIWITGAFCECDARYAAVSISCQMMFPPDALWSVSEFLSWFAG